VARGEVLSAGRRLFVCRAEVEAIDGDERGPCATLLQTIALSPEKGNR
jgi:acyl-coenzyme A thioesterase PaaI-like protein